MNCDNSNTVSASYDTVSWIYMCHHFKWVTLETCHKHNQGGMKLELSLQATSVWCTFQTLLAPGIRSIIAHITNRTIKRMKTLSSATLCEQTILKKIGGMNKLEWSEKKYGHVATYHNLLRVILDLKWHLQGLPLIWIRKADHCYLLLYHRKQSSLHLEPSPCSEHVTDCPEEGNPLEIHLIICKHAEST